MSVPGLARNLPALQTPARHVSLDYFVCRKIAPPVLDPIAREGNDIGSVVIHTQQLDGRSIVRKPIDNEIREPIVESSQALAPMLKRECQLKTANHRTKNLSVHAGLEAEILGFDLAHIQSLHVEFQYRFHFLAFRMILLADLDDLPHGFCVETAAFQFCVHVANIIGKRFLFFFEPLDSLDELLQFLRRDTGVSDISRHLRHPFLEHFLANWKPFADLETLA
jgi:hypothetical protein